MLNGISDSSVHLLTSEQGPCRGNSHFYLRITRMKLFVHMIKVIMTLGVGIGGGRATWNQLPVNMIFLKEG